MSDQNPYIAPLAAGSSAEPASSTRLPLSLRVVFAFASTAWVAWLASFNAPFIIRGQAQILAAAVMIAVGLVPEGCGKFERTFVYWVLLLPAAVGVTIWWTYSPTLNPTERGPALAIWVLLGLAIGVVLVSMYFLLRCIADRVYSAARQYMQQLFRESRRSGSDRKRNVVKLSAVEGIESYAQFGTRVPVVVGRTFSSDNVLIEYEDENIGTEIRVTVSRVDDGRLGVELSFASSDLNLRSDGTRESVDVITSTATHTMEPGIPMIVERNEQYSRVFAGGDSENVPRESSVLILSVEVAEQNKAVNRSTQKRGS